MPNRYPAKEELDIMSEKDIIEQVRRNILYTTTTWDDKTSPDVRYIKELEIYCDLRFKEHAVGISTTVLEMMGKTHLSPEGLYHFLLNNRFNAIGEFQYIKGMELPEKV